MKCARVFGALITIRDEPLDAPIPKEFQLSDYHLRELEKARQRLKEGKNWDEEWAEKEAEKAYQEAVRIRNEIITRQTQLRQRYEKMLAQVEAWIPPTPDHRELKQFMIEQLKRSIEFDCGHIPDEPQRLTGAEYKRQQLEEAQRAVDYYEEKVSRVKETNKWLQALRESLR